MTRVAAVALALCVSSAAAAEPPAAPAPSRYPLSVRVALAPEARAARFEHDDRVVAGPPGASITVDLAEPARAAYAAAAGDVFRAVVADGADAELEVAAISGEAVLRGGVWHAVVRHDVVLRAKDGAALARFRGEGDQLIGLDAGGFPKAFAAATRRAANALGDSVDRAPELGAWLAARGLPRRTPPGKKPPAPNPPRAGWVAFAEVAPGVASSELALAARAGVAMRWALVEVALDRWQGSFGAAPTFAPGSEDPRYTALALGVDTAAVGRIGRSFELRAGVGVHAVVADATLRYSLTSDPAGTVRELAIQKHDGAASLFAAAQYTTRPFFGWGVRGRLGAEVRKFSGASARFDTLGAEADLAPGAFFRLFLGVELPLGGSPPPAGAAAPAVVPAQP